MELKINRLPAYTFGWLQMNEAVLEDVSAGRAIEAQVEVPEGLSLTTEERSGLEDVKTGSGEDMDKLVKEAGVSRQVLEVPAGADPQQALRILIPCEEGANAVNSYGAVLGEGSHATVVLAWDGDRQSKGFSAAQMKFVVGKNARLDLVQIVRGGEDYQIISDVGIDCGEGADVHVVHLFLSGKEIYQGLLTNLKGEGSHLLADVAYTVHLDHKLDMNYFADQTGKNTKSEMYLNGVLRDTAKKMFRGSIDFKKGCGGSTGDEKEDVLLIDDGVENKTIPLILCDEEDVEGNHGATIGRLDEEILFYMASRGLSEEQIYSVMADARIEAVVRKIPDDIARKRLHDEMEDELRTCRREERR